MIIGYEKTSPQLNAQERIPNIRKQTKTKIIDQLNSLEVA